MEKQCSPYLCGGVFFLLLTEAKEKPASRRQLQSGLKDRVSNKNILEALIQLIVPSFHQPSVGKTFGGDTSDYRACKVSHGLNLPFDDTTEIDGFDNRVKSQYQSVVRQMDTFVDNFLHIRQFFCMTHNPYFFREISYNRLPDYECVSFFEIKKDTQNQTSITECQDEDTIAGGGLINRSPVRNTYDTLWHEYATTSDPDTLLIVIRQILEYYFIQMVGYQNGNLRSDLLDKNEREFVRILDDGSEDRSDYVSAAAMIAMLNVGATGFNDGLYYDSSATSVEQLRSVFERIFKVMHQEQHFNMMTRKAR